MLRAEVDLNVVSFSLSHPNKYVPDSGVKVAATRDGVKYPLPNTNTFISRWPLQTRQFPDSQIQFVKYKFLGVNLFCDTHALIILLTILNYHKLSIILFL